MTLDCPPTANRLATVEQPARADEVEIARLRKDYLDLMCESLVGRLNRDPPLQQHLSDYDDAHRVNGWDWPSRAPSMIGLQRMTNLRDECERVLREDVPGDFLEAGVWRGGACMMMRAVLKAYGVRNRRVIAADTYAGMPPQQIDDAETEFLRGIPEFAVSLDEVKQGFERYHLLDEQVVFLQGRFADTLPTAPVVQLAVLRLDGDTFESARDALAMLYDKVALSGSIIVDDYFLFSGNRRAIDEFRQEHAVSEPIIRIDDYGGYWIKRASETIATPL